MSCAAAEICGGCLYRGDEEEAYRSRKRQALAALLPQINQADVSLGEPVFIPDGTRRRASLAFSIKKGCLTLGFNRRQSSELVNLPCCPLLTPGLNAVMPVIRRLLQEICAVPYTVKTGKKIQARKIDAGDVWLTETDAGVDVVLEYDATLELEHRMIIFELANAAPEIVRISHRCKVNSPAEPVVEKTRPYITIGSFSVYIPAGTFLQPSKQGEQALTALVQKYLGETRGKIADLFCGVGTFSYVLAADPANKITAVDSSASLLEGFRDSVNRNQIPNIQILTRNLFKYPLDSKELAGFDAVVFDPPRAGASAQAAQLAAMDNAAKPSKIIAVSCNPHSFVTDANILIGGGYRLEEITLVDQFIYSNHSELVALFTKV